MLAWRMVMKHATGNTLTLQPTRWKWLIAALLSLLIPLLGVFLFGICLAIAFGPTHSITLKSDGFEVLQWGKSSAYRWNEVGRFDLHTFRYMFIPILRRVTFTPVTKEGKLLTHTSKLLTGGTEKIPAVGMPAKALANLMNHYRDDYIAQMGDQPLPRPDTLSSARPDSIRAQTSRKRSKTYAQPRANTPAKEKTKVPEKSKNHKASPFGQTPKQDPLVQDGLGRRWRTRK